MSAGPNDANDSAAAAFVERWRKSGAAERANYQLFLSELCGIIDVSRPDPATPDTSESAYVFERPVTFDHGDGTSSTGFIDLYKRGCFVLEAKQGVDLPETLDLPLSKVVREQRDRWRSGVGRRGSPGWDVAMHRARGQGEQYIRALPADEGRPPFLVVVDVGHCVELYSEFSCTGGAYIPFPSPGSHRISLDELTHTDIRERLRLVWTDPISLDPTRRSARVTREIASRLARLAVSLEADGHAPQAVATFLMRCLFTMFSEDVGLLPGGGFTRLLESLSDTPEHFVPVVGELWDRMNQGGFSTSLRTDVLQFNGGLFEDTSALPLTRDQVLLLIEAAQSDWKDVEPAIFGTLLERALDPLERHKLGAHYTPRAYVERLVMPTIIDPVRAEWESVRAAAFQLVSQDDPKKAVAEVKKFHRRLVEIRVLDPACGSGNFLYVTLEHLKRIEGEVFDVLDSLGEHQTVMEMAGQTVDPHQLLGIEVNPRAAAITELVLWIGTLQWHFRNQGDVQPPPPIIRDFRNIECRDALLDWDAREPLLDDAGNPVTHWDGRTTKPHPVTAREVPDEAARVPVFRYVNPRPAAWPEADYVVGNPPFIGPGHMRESLGDGYTETLRQVHSDISSSSDLVLYWWNHAAKLAREGKLQRFGFVTTNSLRQKFNRRVLQAHLGAKKPLSLLFAIPDHPWVDSADGAAVRIAMTAATGGEHTGLLQTVTAEHKTEGDGYDVELVGRQGKIQADLTIGPDVSRAVQLEANTGISNTGVKLHGAGFIVTPEQARRLGLGQIAGIDAHIRHYRNGRDITARPRGVMVIDLDGLSADDVRARFSAVYQWVHDRVKPERDHNREKYRRENWWLFGRKNTELRAGLSGLARYIATVETSKHRFFVFLDQTILPDNMLVNVALDDAYFLGVLSSRMHVFWALASGGTLEDRPRYNKTRCFETFPFPDPTEEQKARIRSLAEQLDAHRKRQQGQYPDLTITGIYNVIEKLRSGEALTPKERVIHEQGLVSVLKRLHDDLDVAVFEAYGWPSDLSEEQILERLVALNADRAREEAQGRIRWLRPDFQCPTDATQQTGIDITKEPTATPAVKARKSSWPKSLPEQIRVVRESLLTAKAPISADAIARQFTRARTDRIAELLDTLTTLGQARKLDDGRYTVG